MKIRDEHKIILLSAVSAFSIWVMDAAIDSFVFHAGAFLNLLILDVSHHELYFRTLFIASFITFGVLIAKMVSKRNLAEETLRKHRAAMEASMDGMAIFNQNDEYIYVNEAYAKVNGYDDPADLIGKTYRVLYDEKELEKIDRTVAPELQKKGRWQGELTARKKDGSAYYQEVSVALIEGGRNGRVCVIRDITSRKRAEEKLHRSERFLSTIFDSIHDPFSIVDRNYKIVRINEAYAQMRNKLMRDLVGKKCFEVLQGRNSACEECIVEKTFQSADPCAKEKLLTFPDGLQVWVEIYTYPIFDRKGRVSHVIEYTRDITSRKKAEDERKALIADLEYLSTTDSLTGLLNRRALIDILNREVDRANRYGSDVSLILCDIDNFKEINDTYGHTAGDSALHVVAQTFRRLVRKADIVGRYGGDEFLLILPETSLAGARSLAEKIRTSVEKTEFRLPDGQRVNISLSIGVTSSGLAPEDIDSLIKRADDALYASKQTGRNKVSAIAS